MKIGKTLLFLCLGVIGLAGCGQPVCVVKGEINLKNGTPIPSGRVTFTAKEGTASFWASIDSGVFEVDKGLTPPPGEYVVTLTGADWPAVYESDPVTGVNSLKTPAKPIVDPKKYSDVKSSPLNTSIVAGPNELSLTVDP
jgi:hypothetical protein